MNALVVGANGRTGLHLARHLLARGLNVRVIVRSPASLPDDVRSHMNLSVIHAGVLDLSDAEMARHVSGCDRVASCLGHHLTLKGIYGQPRMLVTKTTRRLCEAIRAHAPPVPVRFVLMNTAGNSNRDAGEYVSFGERCVVGLIRALLPPHRDNEAAADHLSRLVGPRNDSVEWTVVRPDTLIDAPEVTDYEVHPSPIRSAIFNAGKTSRINVGHFMAELMTDDEHWSKWKGQMPVIYDKESQ